MPKTTAVASRLALVAAMIALAGFGPAAVNRADNFNNNTLANFWQVRTFGKAGVKETNQRLEFRTTGPTSPLSAAGVRYKRSGIDWMQDFNIQWRSRFKPPPFTAPNQRCFMGTVLVIEGAYPKTMTGLGCGYLKDITGTYFGVVEFANGAITNFVGTVVLPTNTAGGRVRIYWDISGDRLTAIHDHPQSGSYGPTVPLIGFAANYAATHGDKPMTIVQGVLVTGNSFAFKGNKMSIDNWKASFIPRNFP